MSWIGFLLICTGLALVFVGLAILALGAIQLFRQLWLKPPAPAAAPAAPGVNVADLAKLIEAIIKMPQWLLAILAGDLEIWLGFLVDNHKLF